MNEKSCIFAAIFILKRPLKHRQGAKKNIAAVNNFLFLNTGCVFSPTSWFQQLRTVYFILSFDVTDETSVIASDLRDKSFLQWTKLITFQCSERFHANLVRDFILFFCLYNTDSIRTFEEECLSVYILNTFTYFILIYWNKSILTKIVFIRLQGEFWKKVILVSICVSITNKCIRNDKHKRLKKLYFYCYLLDEKIPVKYSEKFTSNDYLVFLIEIWLYLSRFVPKKKKEKNEEEENNAALEVLASLLRFNLFL